MIFRRTCFLTVLFCGMICTGRGQSSIRLNDHWEFLRQDLGGVWEAVRPVPKGDPAGTPVWQPVNLPHCVNATDGVDPDFPYYRGPAWYRTRLDLQNPYAKGRTLLHFEGAGQKTDVYLYTTKVGSHTGDMINTGSQRADAKVLSWRTAPGASQPTARWTHRLTTPIIITLRHC